MFFISNNTYYPIIIKEFNKNIDYYTRNNINIKKNTLTQAFCRKNILKIEATAFRIYFHLLA